MEDWLIFFNIILNNTSPDPPTVINLIMSTLFEKCRGMIFMFVGNMLHERFPFGCDHLLKALLGGCCTPVQMVADSFYPVCYLLTALLFAQLQHLLSNGSSNVPDVKEMGTTRLAFTYPLGNAPVAIRYEDYNCDAHWLEIWKCTLSSLQLHRWTPTSLICL